MPNSILKPWLYILTACINVSNSFSFLANRLMLSIYIRQLIFSYNLDSLYLAVHFLSWWLNGINALTNNYSESASPWKIALWIFTTAKLFPFAVISSFVFFMILSINFTTLSDILYILSRSIIQSCETISYSFL